MAKAFPKPKQPEEMAAPLNVDWGPAVVNGLSLQQRYDRGMLLKIAAEQTEGGIVTAEALKKPAECLLDELLATGALRRSTETTDAQARRRYDAGMWLRETHHEKAELTQDIGEYGVQGGAGGYKPESLKLPESVEWNRACLRDTARALPRWYRLLEAVCCYDRPQYAYRGVRNALDALADHRGM